MALEPVLPTLEDDSLELRDIQRRFWWSLPLTGLVAALAMSLGSVSVVGNALRLRSTR